MKRLFLFFYCAILLMLAIFSWCFVDVNFPFHTIKTLSQFITFNRTLATILYFVFIAALFGFYGYLLWLIKYRKIYLKFVITVIALTGIILFFSWPASAYDIFNYIATAKVTFLYKENPYIVMPIEIPNEPMLGFMHAANKVALYGFVWIAMTGIPWVFGLGNPILTVFTFKSFIMLFYLGLLWFIWQLSGKNLRSLTVFALNPLVILETMVSSHNDVVMMALALAAFYGFQKNKPIISLVLLFFSIFIKFATLALLPIFLYLFYLRFKRQKVDWENIWKWSAIMMFIIFFLSPLREEIYSWYLIWPLAFVALVQKEKLLTWATIGFSFGLPLRFAPYLLTGEWSGLTPLVKKIITFLPPAITATYYEIRKRI